MAPDDASSIFAFDADSGRLVWKTDPIADEVKLSHLLGVAKGRLVATGDRVLLFDVKTGKLRPHLARLRAGLRGLRPGPAGRRPDLLADPERDPGARPGAPACRAEPPIKLMEIYQTTGGNLVVGDGYLIVAQTDALVVFCQNSRLIERYRDEIARAPEQAATYYRLAQAAEAIGQDELALGVLEQALAQGPALRDDRRRRRWPTRPATTSSGS